MALDLKHQTPAQFAARFWARVPPLPTIQAEEWDRCPDVYPRAVERELLIKGTLADCMVILEEMTNGD